MVIVYTPLKINLEKLTKIFYDFSPKKFRSVVSVITGRGSELDDYVLQNRRWCK